MFSLIGSQTLTVEEIRARIVQRLRDELPGLAFETQISEPHQLKLSHPESGDLTLNLGKLLREMREAKPRTAEQLVDRFVALAKQAVCTPDFSLASVYPALRGRAFMQQANVHKSDGLMGDGPGDMVSVVLVDVGDCTAILTEEAAANSGYAAKDVLVAAEKNFVDIFPGSIRATTVDDGFVSLSLQDYAWLGTSILFVPLLLTRVMADKGWERALVAAPTRESVELIDVSNGVSVSKLESWMVECLAGPRPQSELILGFQRGAAEYTNAYRMLGEKLAYLN